jgi:hypothetical protein
VIRTLTFGPAANAVTMTLERVAVTTENANTIRSSEVAELRFRGSWPKGHSWDMGTRKGTPQRGTYTYSGSQLCAMSTKRE